MNDKQEFISLFSAAARHRAGHDDFLEWLIDTDFFIAPASSKYHGAKSGMLARHSLNVCKRLMAAEQEYKRRGGNVPESLAIAGLLHDVCKVNVYERDDATGDFKYKGDSVPVGHGERSVILIQQHGMCLTIEEIVAIRWHMGAFDDAFRGGSRDMQTAFKKYPLAVLLHLADMAATYLDEAEE